MNLDRPARWAGPRPRNGRAGLGCRSPHPGTVWPMSSPLSTVAGWVADAERVMVLTGAGISTDSGIPDFRGPNGVWTRDPGRAAVHPPALPRRPRGPPPGLAGPARPPGLDGTQRRPPGPGRPRARRAGSRARHPEHRRPAPAGRVPATWSSSCTARWGTSCAWAAAAAHARWPTRSTGSTPARPTRPCPRCGGILKSATISFGQPLDRRPGRAAEAAAGCDLFLAVGTSLQVHPAAGLCDSPREAGARFVIVNAADPVRRDGRRPSARTDRRRAARARPRRRPKEPGTAVSA